MPRRFGHRKGREERKNHGGGHAGPESACGTSGPTTRTRRRLRSAGEPGRPRNNGRGHHPREKPTEATAGGNTTVEAARRPAQIRKPRRAKRDRRTAAVQEVWPQVTRHDAGRGSEEQQEQPAEANQTARPRARNSGDSPEGTEGKPSTRKARYLRRTP